MFESFLVGERQVFDLPQAIVWAALRSIQRVALFSGPGAVQLGIEIHAEFLRVRPQSQGINFVGLLVPDPGVNHIRCKDIALQ